MDSGFVGTGADNGDVGQDVQVAGGVEVFARAGDGEGVGSDGQVDSGGDDAAGGAGVYSRVRIRRLNGFAQGAVAITVQFIVGGVDDDERMGVRSKLAAVTAVTPTNSPKSKIKMRLRCLLLLLMENSFCDSGLFL